MNVLKNKLVLGFLIFVLAISVGIGITVWHYGSTYEKTAAVCMRKLDWVLPHSTNYRHIYFEEDSSGLYRCSNREKVDYIDTSGEIVKTVSAQEDSAEAKLAEDRYAYMENDLTGIKTEAGDIVVPAKYAWISAFQNGYACAGKLTGSDVIIDIDGNVLKESDYGIRYLSGYKYAVELKHYREEVFDVRTGENWDNYQGRPIDSVWVIDENHFALGFNTDLDDGQYVTDYLILDDNMTPVYGNRMFTVLGRDSDGMRYFVSSERTFDGKPAERQCGFLDEKGQVVFTFDHVPACVNDFSEGLTLVYDDQLQAYDKTGKQVFALDYTGQAVEAAQRQIDEEYAHYSPYYTYFSNGLAPITLDGEKWGYVNQEGEIVVEPLFKNADIVYDSTAAVCVIQSDIPSTLNSARWGILDLREVQ